jgi:hypothetical protein
VTTAKPNETLQVMFDQIDFLQRQTIPQEGLRTIISGYLTNYYLKLETNDAQAARLAEYELLGGGWQRSLTWIEQVRRVTGDDIKRCRRHIPQELSLRRGWRCKSIQSLFIHFEVVAGSGLRRGTLSRSLTIRKAKLVLSNMNSGWCGTRRVS